MGAHTSEWRGGGCSTPGKRSSPRSSVLEDAGPQHGHLMPWLCCASRRMEPGVLLAPPSQGPSYRHWQGVPCGPGLLGGCVGTGRVRTCARAGGLLSPRPTSHGLLCAGSLVSALGSMCGLWSGGDGTFGNIGKVGGRYGGLVAEFFLEARWSRGYPDAK